MAADSAPAVTAEAKSKANDMLSFINAAWTPYHAVEEASRRLLAAGFTHIAEKDAWNLKPGGRYFFTRNMSTLVAFAIGKQYQPGHPFYMIGAHTDSPCLKVGCGTPGLTGTWAWQHRLVKIDRPVLRIPMLAIHLQRNLYQDGFKPNFQDNLKPPGVLGGAQEEFVFVGRLDNLASCYTALEALIDSVADEDSLVNEHAVRSVAMFDHEEVGSDSAQGAGGPVMRDTITRVARLLAQGEEGAVERTLRQSFLVSADMAHALHPNYTDKHDSLMAPAFQGGLVLKHNSNQRYATNAISAALFREVGRQAGVPVQEFCVRNDMPCGSTIGPILAHNLGCRTVDVGMPQLAMHSIREMAGVDDVLLAYKHFLAFFKNFTKLDASLNVDSLPPPDIKGTIRDPQCSHVH
eukprot:gene4980-5222_t